jgi:hypothetical protein
MHNRLQKGERRREKGERRREKGEGRREKGRKALTSLLSPLSSPFCSHKPR